MSTAGLLSSASPSLAEVLFTFDINGFVILPAVLAQPEVGGMLVCSDPGSAIYNNITQGGQQGA